MKSLLKCLVIMSLMARIQCEDIVRLTNIKSNVDNVQGEVEFYYEGLWRPLCARMWAHNDANTVCKAVGFHEGAVDHIRNDMFGEPKRRNERLCYRKHLMCEGSENDVTNCRNWDKIMDLQTCALGIAIAVCKR